MLTQKRLKEVLHYDPDTGVLTCKEARSGAKVGKPQGTIGYYGYLSLGIDYKTYRAHRLAWLYMHGSFPDHEIDHINGVRHDNRIDNLRAVSHQENSKNSKRRADNKSTITGVSWNKLIGKWHAYINNMGKRTHLGHWDEIEDAIRARKAAEIEHGFHPNHGRVT